MRNLKIRIEEWLDVIQAEGISVDRPKMPIILKHGQVVPVRAASDLDRVAVGRIAEIDRLIHIQVMVDHYHSTRK
jgi:hypothetical protein